MESHPPKYQSSDAFEMFETQIKSWKDPQCKCAFCKFVIDTDACNLQVCKVPQIYDCKLLSTRSSIEHLVGRPMGLH